MEGVCGTNPGWAAQPARSAALTSHPQATETNREGRAKRNRMAQGYAYFAETAAAFRELALFALAFAFFLCDWDGAMMALAAG